MKQNRKHYQDTNLRNKREKILQTKAHWKQHFPHEHEKQNHLSTNQHSKCVTANSPLNIKSHSSNTTVEQTWKIL